jgi:hypothetical protein
VGPPTLEGLAAKEQVSEALRRVRFELEDVRNMVTQVRHDHSAYASHEVGLS